MRRRRWQWMRGTRRLSRFFLPPSLSAEKRKKRVRGAGNAATKDNSCAAGGQRELLRRRTTLSPPGAERHATKLCPVLHENRLVLHERSLSLPAPALSNCPRCAGCLYLVADAGEKSSLLPRTHLHLEEPTEFLYRLDGTDPKTKRLLSCQLSGTKSRRRRLAGEKTNNPRGREKGRKERVSILPRESMWIYRVNNRGMKKKKVADRSRVSEFRGGSGGRDYRL